MTANIIAFPTAVERADAEFRRTGEIDLKRAQDKAIALIGTAAVDRHCIGNMTARLETFRVSVDQLARSGHDVVEDIIILNEAGGRVWLLLMPGLISAPSKGR